MQTQTAELWYRAAHMRQIEATCFKDAATAAPILMERAGRAAWDVLLQQWPNARRIWVVCGTGNNGGDGYVLARHAHAQKRDVQVIAMGPPRTPLAQAAAQQCRMQGVVVRPFTNQCMSGAALLPPDVLVDAVLGIGTQGQLRPEYCACIRWMNQYCVPRFSLDLPSGLHADTGEVHADCAVKATCTLTFLGKKIGCILGQGLQYTGRLLLADLHVPRRHYQSVAHQAFSVSASHVRAVLPPRSPMAHKGHCGHVLVIGGNVGMWGAAYLAAKASLQMGAGWVSVATRGEHAPLLTLKEPALMSHVVHTPDKLWVHAARASVIIIGPGLGQDAWAKQMLHAVFQDAHCRACPKIIDADALNLLAASPSDYLKEAADLSHAVLTPHPGEARRLLHASALSDVHGEEQSEPGAGGRVSVLQHLYQQWQATIVLKGAATLVGGADTLSMGHYALSSQPNPALAVAGMGDVLAGMIGGLAAQCREETGMPSQALLATCAYAAVYLQQQAGQHARQKKGIHSVLPTDVLDAIPTVLSASVPQ